MENKTVNNYCANSFGDDLSKLQGSKLKNACTVQMEKLPGTSGWENSSLGLSFSVREPLFLWFKTHSIEGAAELCISEALFNSLAAKDVFFTSFQIQSAKDVFCGF